MKSTEAASAILAIDGCSLSCTKKCLEEAGFRRFEHLLVTDLGFSKGEAEVSTESVGKIAAEGVKLLTKGAFL